MRGSNLVVVLVLVAALWLAWANKDKLAALAAAPSSSPATTPPPASLPAAQPGTSGGVDPNVALVTGTIASLVGKGLDAAFARSQQPIKTTASSTGGFDTVTGIPWRPT